MSSYSLKDIKNAGELSDDIKPPSKSAEYVHNELLPKMNPTFNCRGTAQVDNG